MFGEPRRDGWTPPLAETIERVAWWAEIFQTPCVAFRRRARRRAPLTAAGADFVALGDAVWVGALGRAGDRRRPKRRRARRRRRPDEPMKARRAAFAGDLLALAAPAAAQTFSPPFTPPAGAADARARPGARSRVRRLSARLFHHRVPRGDEARRGEPQRRRRDDLDRRNLSRRLRGPQDEAEAARWYRLASGLGDREAAFALGMLLLNGAPGIDKDRAGAKAQFEIAAAKGQAGALYNLGVMAIEGDGRRLSPISPRPPTIFAAPPRPATTTAPIPTACCCARAAAFRSISGKARIGSNAPPTAASSPARSNTRSCCSTASASKRTKPRRRRSSHRGGAQQSDRAKPPRPSLCHRPRRAPRSGRGGDLESLRQGRRHRRPRTRRRDRQSDAGRKRARRSARAPSGGVLNSSDRRRPRRASTSARVKSPAKAAFSSGPGRLRSRAGGRGCAAPAVRHRSRLAALERHPGRIRSAIRAARRARSPERIRARDR